MFNGIKAALDAIPRGDEGVSSRCCGRAGTAREIYRNGGEYRSRDDKQTTPVWVM
jgi:hypothetical protein